MNCDELDAILDRHEADALNAAGRAAVDVHLASCPRCADSWHADRSLAADAVVGPPPELLRRIVSGLEPGERRCVSPGRERARARQAGGSMPVAPPRRRSYVWARAAVVGAAALLTVVALWRGEPNVARAPEAAGSQDGAAQAEPVRGAAELAPSGYAAGVHYARTPETLRAEPGTGRFEVAHAFIYACRPCYAAERRLVEWSAAQPGDVDVVRVPVVFDDRARLHARAFYAARSLGMLDEIHRALLEEIHERGNALDSEAALSEVFARFGVAPQRFAAALGSAEVAGRVENAIELSRAHAITAVPALVVDGRYVTGPAMAGSYEAALDVADRLLESERRGACPAAPPC